MNSCAFGLSESASKHQPQFISHLPSTIKPSSSEHTRQLVPRTSIVSARLKFPTISKMQSRGGKQTPLQAGSFYSSLIVLGTLCLTLGALVVVDQVRAMQMVEQADTIRNQPTATLAVVENPETTVRVLESLLRSILYSSVAELQPTSNGAQKRGLDLGISRGFSGSQAGKHLIGLSAASFANGPGKR